MEGQASDNIANAVFESYSVLSKDFVADALQPPPAVTVLEKTTTTTTTTSITSIISTTSSAVPEGPSKRKYDALIESLPQG
jgi:hypothetical protein